MSFTQYIDADKLDVDFVAYIKSLFKGQKIKLTIETELDETDYLMASEVNHQRLLKSILQIKKRQKLN